ncbi:ABC transporter ATP-binding protein [Clostridium sp.]|uniref:ABC transporter ATP-binding protein n=1 Tax=Clostridium sp. TaxID=1506 RepID=UPI002FC917A9
MKGLNEIVIVDNVDKIYGVGDNSFYALNKVSLRVYEGDFIGIMGPSGSGKSTFLNILATLDVPSRGKLLINGKNVQGMADCDLSAFRRENIGFIFQNFNLLDTLTIKDNILSSVILAGLSKEECDERLEMVSKKMDIEAILDKYPAECSGGQNQRAAVCRALISNPKIIVADEPTGALDTKNSNELIKLLSKLNREDGITIVIVTHDSVIGSYCKKLLLIRDGEVDATLNRGAMTHRDFYYKIVEETSKECESLFMENEEVVV